MVEHPHTVTALESARTSHISLKHLAKAVLLKGDRGFVLAVLPALGPAYGLEVVIDDSLTDESEIYFEGGDHASLVHVSGSTFRQLLSDARHARFAGAS